MQLLSDPSIDGLKSREYLIVIFINYAEFSEQRLLVSFATRSLGWRELRSLLGCGEFAALGYGDPGVLDCAALFRSGGDRLDGMNRPCWQVLDVADRAAHFLLD